MMIANLSANDMYINGIFAFLKNDFDKSIDCLSRAIELKPDHKLAFMSRGAAYLRLNRLDEAIADFDRAIELNPDLARPYHLRGLAREMRGSHDEAIADFERAMALDPEYAAVYYSRSTLHTKLGNENLAVDDIQMVQHLTNKKIETVANENNIWRSQHLRLETLTGGEMDR